MRLACKYHQCMSNIQIRSVPEDVHRTLKARAAQQGQSLSEYALAILRQSAEAPTFREIYERGRLRGPGTATTQDVVDIIRADRENH